MARAAAETSHGQELLAFAHTLRLGDVPPDVAERATTCLMDALGCGVFGSGQEWSCILADEMIADGSAGHSTVIGRAEPLAAPAAALCNGTAIHGFELDDLIAESITHPAACVIPAAIAAAESTDAPGGRLVEAIIVGYEVMHRVGLALGVEPAQRGFHKTSLVGPVACAAAAGKVLGLPLDRLLSAVGIACSAASGIKSFAAGRGGGMVKRLHLGRAAEAGVRAAQLASRGFAGPPFALDSRFGLMEVYGGAGALPERMSQGLMGQDLMGKDLGEAWALRDVWFKVYPICGWIQSVVQLAVEQRGPRPLTPQEVKSVRVGVSRYAAQNNGEPAPVDTMGAQYSIPYCAAVALTGDPRDPARFSNEAVNDPAMRALAAKVEIVIDPAVEAVYPAKFGASFTLIRADGSASERTVLECRGTPSDPCSRQELTDKFHLLAGSRLSADAVSTLAAMIPRAADLASVRELTRLLRPQPEMRPARKTA
jgi:2-methylcitrate dehydratase PrpD